MTNEELIQAVNGHPAGVTFNLEEAELLWNAVRAITRNFRGHPETLMTVRYKLNKLLYEARVENLRKEFAERLG